MLLDAMGERVHAHDLANIARPHEPLGGLFSALRSSPVRECMLAALHMGTYACTYACVGSRLMVWQHVELRDVYGPQHARSSSFFLGTLHSAIRGGKEREMIEICAEFEENRGCCRLSLGFVVRQRH